MIFELAAKLCLKRVTTLEEGCSFDLMNGLHTIASFFVPPSMLSANGFASPPTT